MLNNNIKIMATYTPLHNDLTIDPSKPVYLVDVDDTLVKNTVDCKFDEKLTQLLKEKQVFLFTKMNRETITFYDGLKYNSKLCFININRYTLIKYLNQNNVQVKAVIVPTNKEVNPNLKLGEYYSEYLQKLEYKTLYPESDRIQESDINHTQYRRYDTNDQYKNNIFNDFLNILPDETQSPVKIIFFDDSISQIISVYLAALQSSVYGEKFTLGVLKVNPDVHQKDENPTEHVQLINDSTPIRTKNDLCDRFADLISENLDETKRQIPDLKKNQDFQSSPSQKILSAIETYLNTQDKDRDIENLKRALKAIFNTEQVLSQPPLQTSYNFTDLEFNAWIDRHQNHTQLRRPGKFLYINDIGLSSTGSVLDWLVETKDFSHYNQISIYDHSIPEEGRHTIEETRMTGTEALKFLEILRMRECFDRFIKLYNELEQTDKLKQLINNNSYLQNITNDINDHDDINFFYRFFREEDENIDSGFFYDFTNFSEITYVLLQLLKCYNIEKIQAQKNQIIIHTIHLLSDRLFELDKVGNFSTVSTGTPFNSEKMHLVLKIIREYETDDEDDNNNQENNNQAAQRHEISDYLITSEDLTDLDKLNRFKGEGFFQIGTDHYDLNIKKFNNNIKIKIEGLHGSGLIPKNHKIKTDGYTDIYITSDLHADYRKLVDNLVKGRFISIPQGINLTNDDIYKPEIITNSNWLKKNTLFVIVGDLIDGLRNGGKVNDPRGSFELLLHLLLYNLRLKALEMGSEILFTIGNHDLHSVIIKDDSLSNHYIHAESERYFGNEPNNRKEVLRPFYTLSPYLFVELDDGNENKIICVHGGLHSNTNQQIPLGMLHALQETLNSSTDLNETIENQRIATGIKLIAFKGQNDREDGALWSRFYAKDQSEGGGAACKVIKELKNTFVIVGHCPTDSDNPNIISIMNNSDFYNGCDGKNNTQDTGKGCVVIDNRCLDKDSLPLLAFVDSAQSEAFRINRRDNNSRPIEYLHLRKDSLIRTTRRYNTISRFVLSNPTTEISMFPLPPPAPAT